MKVRLIVGATLIALLALLTWLDSRWREGYIYIVMAGVITIFALREFYDMTERAGARVPRVIGLTAGLAVVLVQWLMGLDTLDFAGGLTTFVFTRPGTVVGILTIACLLSLLVRVWTGNIEGALLSVGATILGLIYIPVMITFMTAIRRNWSIACLIGFIAVCKTGDAAAYFVGSRWGRVSLAPRVSPKKTVEGGIAALVASVLVALLCTRLGALKLAPVMACVFGLLIGIVAIVGDLAESVMKRDSQIKDSATFLPGFGGVLDLIDDLLFAAPVAYYFFRLTIQIE